MTSQVTTIANTLALVEEKRAEDNGSRSLESIAQEMNEVKKGIQELYRDYPRYTKQESPEQRAARIAHNAEKALKRRIAQTARKKQARKEAKELSPFRYNFSGNNYSEKNYQQS